MADLLAVANAPGGTFTGTRLTLDHVRPAVTWFTDRPYRDAGFFSVAEMVRLFFARQSPPNAALEFAGAGGAHHVAIVEVSAPRYEPRKGRLTFRAKLIAKSDTVSQAEHPWLSSFASRNEAKVPRRFGAVTAFFDSAPASAQSPDEALVDKLSGEYEPLVVTWGRAVIFIRGCLDSTKQEIWGHILAAAVLKYESFLPLLRDVEGLQRTVSAGGTLSTQQQQLAAELEAKLPEQQKAAASYAALEKGGC